MATGMFSPLGDGEADPRGRGGPIFDDTVGLFIPVLFGLTAGWIVWLATDRKNWSIDLLVATPIFLLAGPIASANWASADVIFTRDAQALLNILLVASGIAVAYALQKSLKRISSTFVLVLASTVLAICIFAFVAIPLWYTLSYLSAKLGAGKLDSLDAAAKAVGAAGSLLAVLGLQWKEGRLDLIVRPSGEKKS
jgi:uncharacterized membrane protein YbjE (DUF340 family)